MITILSEIFSYSFMVRALIVGTLISLCSLILGVSLVFKKYSMIGHGLSNVGFGALSFSTAFNLSPLLVSMPIVIGVAFLLLRISEGAKTKGDSAIAIISTGSLGVGVVILSMTTGMNTDVCNYLFGSILGMSKFDVNITIVLCIMILIFFVFLYNKIFLITFDENFAKATGNNTKVYNLMLSIITSIIIVLGMRMMGSLLISSLIVFPAISAMRVCKNYFSITITSAIISVTCLWVGMIISYVFSTPTGSSIVLCNIFVFIVYWIISNVKGLRYEN